MQHLESVNQGSQWKKSYVLSPVFYCWKNPDMNFCIQSKSAWINGMARKPFPLWRPPGGQSHKITSQEEHILVNKKVLGCNEHKVRLQCSWLPRKGWAFDMNSNVYKVKSPETRTKFDANNHLSPFLLLADFSGTQIISLINWQLLDYVKT